MRCRPSAVGLVVLFSVLTALIAPTSAAADDRAGITGAVTPGFGLPGASVRVESENWPAYTQVQAVVCGDLAIGGSNTCDQSAGQLGAADQDGKVVLDVVVGDPPRPCPCVVRVASYGGPALSIDIPFVVTGHPIDTPPQPEVPAARVVVSDIELQGSGGWQAMFGAAPERRVVLTLQNTGSAPAVDPQVSLGVGKGESTEPSSTTTTDLTIEPLQSAEVSVQVGLPIAAFGDFQVVAQVGDDPATASRTTWSAYPWGLIALNVVGLALLLWGVWRRTTSRRRAEAAGRAAGHRATADGYALPDVVYVAALGGFLVSPRAASRSRVLRKVEGRLEAHDLATMLVSASPLLDTPSTGSQAPSVDAGAAVVDLAAVESWLGVRGGHARRGIEDPTPEPERGETPMVADAVVDVDAVDRWLERRDSLKGSA